MRVKYFLTFAVLLLVGVSFAFGQKTAEKPKSEKPKNTKKQNEQLQAADAGKTATAEQIAESAVYIYGSLGGRDYLKQIRKTTIERGKISLVNAEGKTEQSNYERLIMRGESLDKERIRIDQEYPNGRFAMIYNNDKVFGLFNDAVFAPREDATKAFQNQIWHGLEALLRYKENNSTLNLVKREKIMNVDFHVLEVTDKQNRQTRFYISTKTLRVMMLEYTQDDVKYRRKFYDYNYAQGTLVPFRSVLWAGEKQVEETNIQTISFGQKVEENIFNES
ncbi:MAG: hypothetical protein LH614_02875 [Pyrinomonadaceae bacterium]|nr:hypothetical protein [Pyrinomonadaceae bacterium]